MLVVSDHPARFEPGSVLHAGDPPAPLTVRARRERGGRTVVAFAEVSDRTGAEALRGLDLVIPAESARALEDGEYWDHDLVGCAVVTTAGEQVGVVTDVLHQQASALLSVRRGDREVLIPLVAAIVTDVRPGERITIDPPDGLIEPPRP